jgi:hypothetical protein
MICSALHIPTASARRVSAFCSRPHGLTEESSFLIMVDDRGSGQSRIAAKIAYVSAKAELSARQSLPDSPEMLQYSPKGHPDCTLVVPELLSNLRN